MDIVRVLGESLAILAKQPKLFLPKIFIAFLYGTAMIAIAGISLKTIAPILAGADPSAIKAMAEMLPLLFGLLAYTIFIYLVDVLVNAMYPVMVRDFKQGNKISFKAALSAASKTFVVVLPAMLSLMLLDLFVAVIFALIMAPFILSGNIPALAISFIAFLAVSFLLVVFFYVVYPVSVLKEKNFVSALKTSFSIGSKHKKEISIPSIIPFTISLVNFAVGFPATESLFFLALFVLLRFLIALVSTYHMVLNPNVYFELVGK